MVGRGVLRGHWLRAHVQVALGSRLQLLHLIQGGWVQRVGVDEAHKILFVVCPGETVGYLFFCLANIKPVRLAPCWALAYSDKEG